MIEVNLYKQKTGYLSITHKMYKIYIFFLRIFAFTIHSFFLYFIPQFLS